jgi:hypothetical protein
MSMNVELRPEVAALIEAEPLYAREEWLAANRDGIAALVEAGCLAAEPGRVRDAPDVHREIEQRKLAWFKSSATNDRRVSLLFFDQRLSG